MDLGATRDLGQDALALVAAAGSFALGCAAMHKPESPFAAWHGFEASAVIVASTLLARAAYSRLWAHALADLAASERARAGTARRLGEEDLEDQVARESLTVGDRVRVLEGELVPADVRLDAGAVLSLPQGSVTLEAGAIAPAGALVLSASLTGRVARAFRASIAAAIDAEIHRAVARLERELGGWAAGDGWGDLATQALFAGAFTFGAFALAAHLALGGVAASADAWFAAVAVIVAASPAAFVLAAPLTRAIALLRARSAGIVVRDPRALDALARVDAALFEKTGTLSTGEPEVTSIVWTGAAPDRSILEDVAAVERRASHPVGRAIAAYLRAREIVPTQVAQNAAMIEGPHGISGRLREALVEIGPARRFPGAVSAEAPPAATVAWFARNGTPLGYFVLSDPLRPGGDVALRALWRRGVPCRLVSGDRSEAALAAAHRLGVPGQGGLTTADKALVVRDLQHGGARVLYVRDAAAHGGSAAHADVWIAVAPETLPQAVGAPIVLTDGRLDKLAWLLDLARAARWRAIECCALAIVYNAIAVPLASVGKLTPLQAATLALCESLLCLANASRLLVMPRHDRTPAASSGPLREAARPARA